MLLYRNGRWEITNSDDPGSNVYYISLEYPCTWSPSLALPPAPVGEYVECGIILKDADGFFWLLIVDADGNVGAQSDAGPETAAPVLADGAGGFWQLIVDTSGLRGTQSHSGPATANAVVVVDGASHVWQLVVDSGGNLGTTLIV